MACSPLHSFMIIKRQEVKDSMCKSNHRVTLYEF